MQLDSSFLPFSLSFGQMEPCSECHQMCIISGGWNRHRTGAPNVSVAQLVGQGLNLIGFEVIIIPKNMIMRRSACPLQKLTAVVQDGLLGIAVARRAGTVVNRVEFEFVGFFSGNWNFPSQKNNLIDFHWYIKLIACVLLDM